MVIPSILCADALSVIVSLSLTTSLYRTTVFALTGSSLICEVISKLLAASKAPSVNSDTGKCVFVCNCCRVNLTVGVILCIVILETSMVCI